VLPLPARASFTVVEHGPAQIDQCAFVRSLRPADAFENQVAGRIPPLSDTAGARRFGDAMRQRLEQFALELHGSKTRLLEFGRHAAARRKRSGLGKPETFSFLGFTFICGRSRRGAFQLQRKSRGDRMRAKLREVKEELRSRMHHAIPEQGRWLRAVVTGFFGYHAVPTNARALGAFRHYVSDLWRRTISHQWPRSRPRAARRPLPPTIR